MDVAIEGLIKTDANNVSRVLTFGEFEAVLKADLRSNGTQYGVLVDIFTEFHPHTRPVLWRILIAQALLYRRLINIFRKRVPLEQPIEAMAEIPQEEYMMLSWSKHDSQYEAEEAEPFSAAAEYFKAHLPVLFDELRQPVQA